MLPPSRHDPWQPGCTLSSGLAPPKHNPRTDPWVKPTASNRRDRKPEEQKQGRPPPKLYKGFPLDRRTNGASGTQLTLMAGEEMAKPQIGVGLTGEWKAKRHWDFRLLFGMGLFRGVKSLNTKEDATG